MTTRTRNLLALGAVVVFAAAAMFAFRPKLHVPTAADAIPDGAFLFATVDLERLRASPLGQEISALRDVSEIAETCGFDPLARVTSAAIGVPEKPDGVFGVSVVTRDISEDDLLGCAKRVMSARSAEPHIVRRGSWLEVEQPGVIADKTRPKIAYRAGSPMLVARADYLATMQAALDGEGARATSSADHSRLRKTALENAHGEPLIVVTAVIPKSVRDRLKDEATSAVLSVNAVALSVTIHGDSLEVFAELDCDTEAACTDLRDVAIRKTKGLPFDLQLEAHATTLDATLTAPAHKLVSTLGGWFRP